MGPGAPSQIEAASRPNRRALGRRSARRDDGGVSGALCGAFVVFEQPAETLVAPDTTVADGFRWFDQLVPEPLMVPLFVIVRKVLGTGSSERSFAEQDELVEAFALDRQHEAFGKYVYLRRQLHLLLTPRRELSRSPTLFTPGTVVNSH